MLHFWCLGGSKRVQTLLEQLLGKAQVRAHINLLMEQMVVIVFDLLNESSFKDVDYWCVYVLRFVDAFHSR